MKKMYSFQVAWYDHQVHRRKLVSTDLARGLEGAINVLPDAAEFRKRHRAQLNMIIESGFPAKHSLLRSMLGEGEYIVCRQLPLGEDPRVTDPFGSHMWIHECEVIE